MKPAFSKETKAAIKAAMAASKIAMAYFSSEKKISKKGERNLVTIADVECEKEIRKILDKEFPDYGFFGEESGNNSSGGKYWVVDPIDGTNNYASGIPIFCHSIALVEGKKPLLGVVYDPTRKDLYVAERGKGAYLNNKRIHVSDKSALIDSIIGTGFPYAADIRRQKTLQSISNLVGSTLGLRRLGAAALDICYVASGLFGGVFFYELSPWDVAAGMLIVEEANGKVTDINGNQADIFSGHYAVSNSALHGQLLEKLVRL